METAFTEIEDLDIWQERKKNPGERKRNREYKSGKRRAARLSCHDGPRSSIFRAEIKWKNVHHLSNIRWARVIRRRWSLSSWRPSFRLFLPLSLLHRSYCRSFLRSSIPFSHSSVPRVWSTERAEQERTCAPRRTLNFSRRGIAKRHFLAREDRLDIPVLSPLIDRRIYVTRAIPICNSTRQRRRGG